MAEYKPKKFGFAAITAVEQTLYTVPAGKIASVSYIDVCNTTSAEKKVTIKLADKEIFCQQDVPAYGIIQYAGGQILNAVETIKYIADVAGCNIFASGWEEI